ncbi:MAG TPA: diiron oxygenase, partial [Acidimicrobiales bacterium]|nr:diiron oxygenase [Acidimicrobiales bacterium]
MAMKAGLQFENVLKRGLLEYAIELPNGSPEFRYAYHELIEEAQHALMFQEFVNRAGLPAGGLPRIGRIAMRWVVKLAHRFPELFFVFVLSGEDPIDHVQRRTLRSGDQIHPLLERIMRIHVTEEARHLSFARQLLRARVPRLPVLRRWWLTLHAPLILGVMSRIMMQVPPQMIREYHIPLAVVRDAYYRNPAHRAEVVESLAKVRRLLGELGLIVGPSRVLWRAFGLFPPGQ